MSKRTGSLDGRIYAGAWIAGRSRTAYVSGSVEARKVLCFSVTPSPLTDVALYFTARWEMFLPQPSHACTHDSRVPVPANPANVCAFAPRLPRPPDSSCARRGPARLLRRRFLGALLLEHPQPRLPRVLHLPAGTQCDAHYTLRVACVQLTAEYSGCSVDTMAHSRVQSQAAGQHRATHPASRAAALRSPASIARIRASCFSLRAAIAAKSADCGSEPSPAPAPDLELDGGGGGGRGGGDGRLRRRR